MSRQFQTIAEQIYQTLRGDIFAQRLRFGEKITTKELQEKLGASSTPIREALTRLQKDGLIVAQPNVGMRVVSYTRKDVLDIYTLMTELDTVALRLACAGGKCAAMTAQLQAVQAQAVKLLMRGDVAGWEELSDEFHTIFYRYSDNSRLSDAANKTRSQMTVFTYAYQQEETNREEIQYQHDAVVHCLEAGDVPAAEEALRRHFASSIEKALRALPEE